MPPESLRRSDHASYIASFRNTLLTCNVRVRHGFHLPTHLSNLYAKDSVGDMTNVFRLRVRIGAVYELAKSSFRIAYVTFLASKVMEPDRGWWRLWFDIFFPLCYKGPERVRKKGEDFLEETDYGKIEIGTKVEAVFEEKRRGDLLDIKHFRIIQE